MKRANVPKIPSEVERLRIIKDAGRANKRILNVFRLFKREGRIKVNLNKLSDIELQNVITEMALEDSGVARDFKRYLQKKGRLKK